MHGQCDNQIMQDSRQGKDNVPIAGVRPVIASNKVGK